MVPRQDQGARSLGTAPRWGIERQGNARSTRTRIRASRRLRAGLRSWRSRVQISPGPPFIAPRSYSRSLESWVHPDAMEVSINLEPDGGPVSLLKVEDAARHLLLVSTAEHERASRVRWMRRRAPQLPP